MQGHFGDGAVVRRAVEQSGDGGAELRQARAKGVLFDVAVGESVGASSKRSFEPVAGGQGERDGGKFGVGVRPVCDKLVERGGVGCDTGNGHSRLLCVGTRIVLYKLDVVRIPSCVVRDKWQTLGHAQQVSG